MYGDSWLSPAQAARVIGVTPQRIRQLMRSGELKSSETPLGRILPRDEVERYARERAEKRQRLATR
jgi:hypothetical protein